MRILHVIPSMAKGGAQRYCADVCAELNKRDGVEVLLLTMSPHNTYSFITDHINYQVCDSKVLPSITGNDVIDTTEYERILREYKPDIIHSHLFWAELLTREIYVEKAKYVTHCQNNMPEFNNFGFSDLFKKSKWVSYYEKLWMIRRYRRCNNNFLVISKDTEDYYRNVLPADLHRITLLYHAINFDTFNRSNIDRSSNLKKIRLVYTARFAIYKNHTFLVDIVNALKKRGMDVHLDFLGDGEYFQEVKNKTARLGLNDEINFAGAVDNVEEYLKNANLYIHPAYYEPFGLVLVEAMAAGLPVVCLDGKGNRDLIEQGKNGYMLFEQDADLFADHIQRITQSADIYQKFADYAISYAKKFDIKVHVDRLLEYYKSL